MLSQENEFCMAMTVLERQQARLKWLQQLHSYGNQQNVLESSSMPQFQGFFGHTPETGELVDSKKKPGMYLGSSGLPRYGDFSLAASEIEDNKLDLVQAELRNRHPEIHHCLSRTSSFHMGLDDSANIEKLVENATGEDVTLKGKTQTSLKRLSPNKRKQELVAAECKDKRIKGDLDLESTVKEKSTKENSAGLSKQNQNTSTAQKTDYIHVRARRGQATDSHSLAERARREKISKKMKSLQDLVPGCNKITGRAGMLDEIINYVQSLQRQVEFLSMKLAALNPRTELNLDNFSKREFPAYVASFPAATLSSAMDSLSHLQLNLVQQASAGSEPELLKNLHQVEPEKTPNSSAFIPELSLDSSSFSQAQSIWDADLQALHNMGFHLHQG
ncbi:hypothetical protein Tsubulata_048290 [Turnera subulata]|uniref:BHLH domain-containing protein n=1 Tax=Turnera subulata TaxID=218843 RepID=A0A9Q0JPS3_9ROSI|nr:hypothetical protein Tsubulata_048290 [Turnera subulata]